MKKEEHYLQSTIIKYLRYNKILLFAVPNGAKRNIFVARQLKIEGVLAGVSDLIIVLKNRVVFVEIKTDKGRQQETQKIFQKQVEELGHTYLIWRNLNDAMNFVKTIDN